MNKPNAEQMLILRKWKRLQEILDEFRHSFAGDDPVAAAACLRMQRQIDEAIKVIPAEWVLEYIK